MGIGMSGIGMSDLDDDLTSRGDNDSFVGSNGDL